MILTTLVSAAVPSASASAPPPPTSLRELERHHTAGVGGEALRTALEKTHPAGRSIAEAARALVTDGGLGSPLKGADQSCGLMHQELDRATTGR